MTSTEKARLVFYRSAVTMTRMVGGTVAVAVPVEESIPSAVLCWLPPNSELTVWCLLRSGFFWALFRFGAIGAYRFLFFEWSLSKLYGRILGPLGYRSKSDGAFVQVVATTPDHAGKGLSSDLLKWQIARHEDAFPHIPVFLDTANEFSVKVYERLQFRELGRHHLDVQVSSIMTSDRPVDDLQVVMILEPDRI